MPYAYPREAPLVYVTPPQGMVVRPGQHVSAEGRIFHPYIARWREFWDKSNTVDLLAILRDVFAKEPPAVATPTRASVVAPPPQPTSSPPRVPPLPPELERASRQSGQPPSHRNAVSSPPRRPPKEHAGADQPPYSTLSGQDTGWSPDPPPIGNWFRVGHTASQQPLNGIQQPPEAGPPLPQRLSSTQGAAQQYAQSREPAMGQHASYIQNPERPDSVFFAAPQAYSQTTGSRPHGRPPPPPLPPQYHEQRLSSPAGMSPPPGTYPPPAIPGSSAISRPDGLVTAGLLPPPTRALPPYPHAQTPAIQDLLSSPLSADSSSAPGGSTAAPPIAPNPEKDALLRALGAELHKRRVATAEQTRTEMMPALRAQHAAMVKASASLQQEIDELESLDATLSTNERILAESMGRADRVMDDARNEVLPAVDDLLVAPSVVGQQLYKTVAQERALDDTLFVLGKALDLGRIGLDVYLKQTRNLARERFLKKALVEKISRGMGLLDTTTTTRASTRLGPSSGSSFYHDSYYVNATDVGRAATGPGGGG